MSPEEIIQQYRDKPVWTVTWEQPGLDYGYGWQENLTYSEALTQQKTLPKGIHHPSRNVQILLQIEDLE